MRERAIIVFCLLQDFIYKTSALPPFTHVQKKAKAYICVCFMWITINDEYQKIHTYIYKIRSFSTLHLHSAACLEYLVIWERFFRFLDRSVDLPRRRFREARDVTL